MTVAPDSTASCTYSFSVSIGATASGPASPTPVQPKAVPKMVGFLKMAPVLYQLTEK